MGSPLGRPDFLVSRLQAAFPTRNASLATPVIGRITSKSRKRAKLGRLGRRTGLMILRLGAEAASPAQAEAVGATLRTVTKLRGKLELVAGGSLPTTAR